MEVFHHNKITGKCYYVNIPTIINHEDVNMVLVQFLLTSSLTLNAELGIAKKHPKDQYVKKTARDVARSKKKSTNAQVIQVNKFFDIGPKLTIKVGNDVDYIFVTFIKKGKSNRYHVLVEENLTK